MYHAKPDILTDYEKRVVDELVKYSGENTNHFTESCFEQSYWLLEKTSMFATKLFYSSLFNTPEEAKWTIDRILELPDEYKGQCLLELGFNLAVLYKHMIVNDPSLDEKMKDAYAKWVKEL